MLERLDFLSCPRCGEALEPESGRLECFYGHTFPMVDGLPVFLTQSVEDSPASRESFSRQWAHFDYSEDRTWGSSAAQRRAEFLVQVNLAEDDLKGKRVLDAGCGNGVLSNEISTFGCEVVGADVSDAVRAAHLQFTDNPRLAAPVRSGRLAAPCRPCRAPRRSLSRRVSPPTRETPARLPTGGPAWSLPAVLPPSGSTGRCWVDARGQAVRAEADRSPSRA